MKATFLSSTKCFGFLTVALEWITIITCLRLVTLNGNEPFSQYGFHPETRTFFGFMFALCALVYYFFARHLDIYWRYTSLFTLAAASGLIITGIYPYQPDARTLLFDVHNTALILSVIFFTLPMLFIGFSKKHEPIARASRILFFVIFLACLVSLVARTLDTAFIYTQLVMIALLHLWVMSMNILHLKHKSTKAEL